MNGIHFHKKHNVMFKSVVLAATTRAMIQGALVFGGLGVR